MKNASFIKLTVIISVMLIVVYLDTCSNSKNVTDCNKMADEHWSRDKYTQWLIDSLGITSDTMLYWNPLEQEWTYLSHHLPDSKTQQYYEMIGKYEQFSRGWDDYSDFTSQHRSDYLECRHKASEVSRLLPTTPH